jgi:hypothetical protein
MPLFKVNMPANAQMFFNQILQVAAFEFVDLSPYFLRWLKLEQTDAINTNFDALGYNSLYFLCNMNTLFIGYIGYMLYCIAALLLNKCCTRNFNIMSKADDIRDSLFYGSFISMISETYSLVAVCAFVGLSTFEFTSYGLFVDSVFRASAFFMLVAYPVLICWSALKVWD